MSIHIPMPDEFSNRRPPPSHTLRAVIYGPPGIGKSQFATTIPGSFVVSTDGGMKRLSRHPHQCVSSWEELSQFVAEFAKASRSPGFPYQTLVFDLAQGAYNFLSDDICKSKGVRSIGELNEKWGTTLGVRNDRWTRFVATVCSWSHLGIVWILHGESTTRNVLVGGKTQEESYVKPSLPDKALRDLLTYADMCMYMDWGFLKQPSGQRARRERVLYCRDRPGFSAKDRTGKLPDIVHPATWQEVARHLDSHEEQPDPVVSLDLEPETTSNNGTINSNESE